MFKPVDIKEKLVHLQKKTFKENQINNWLHNIFSDLDGKRNDIQQRLLDSKKTNLNVFKIDHVDANAIFHIDQIKQICVTYRLRFLDTNLFKGDYPEEAITKIRDLENLHNTKFSNFKIIAPQELFRIKKADDPLLFAPMGNGYFYLIHKWGNDLHPLRKFKYWAIKNVTTLGLTALFISILFTALSYYISFNNQESAIAYTIVIFLFTFKSVVGIILFLGAASGKNFSEYSWQSKYDKIS